MENLVRPTTLRVVEKSRQVRISQRKIKQISKGLESVPQWPGGFHFKSNHDSQTLDYLIILDSINFCFWNNKAERWTINYKGQEYNGYFALSLALKRFFEENPDKGSLNYFSEISFEEFKKILKGGGSLFFLKERWQIAREVSQILLEKFKDSVSFVRSSNHKLSLFVPAVYKDLPYFKDVSVYRGEEVFFLKRAQILASDIIGAFKNKGVGFFEDPGYLTCFADYKVPQILHHLGILQYSPSLEKKIKNKVLIPQGSEEEIEIRANAVWAVEYFKKELNLCSFEIDWILWNMSQSFEGMAPYHLTKTIFY